jgi:hypothetical protein
MTSRDPGKIEKAFPSRAKELMNSLLAFDQEVLGGRYDLAAEAGGGSRSEPSPARSSAANRRHLTGVTENNHQQGWVSPAVAMPHLCFPPQRYPEGAGPGSRWLCRCDAVWEARGIAWDAEAYPQSPSRREAQLGPERWQYIDGGQLSPEEYRAQEPLWDWRPLGPYFVNLARALIDNQHAYGQYHSENGKKPVTWEELG